MRKQLPLPSLALLKYLFELDSTSPSGLVWKNPRTNSLKPGAIAGKKRKDGYWSVVVTTDKKRNYYVHRIILFMQTGTDPFGSEVDHIDGIEKGNLKLRTATRTQNSANTEGKKFKDGSQTTSKYKGVFKSKGRTKWCAQIYIDGQSKHLGCFDEEIEAAKAYNIAAKKAWGNYAKLNKIYSS